jgi:diphthine synthase
MGTTMAQGKLTFIGLGLYDEQDISRKGFDEIQHASQVFAEFYTSQLAGSTLKKLEQAIGKPITLLSRAETEKGTKILEAAKKQLVVLLVVGDPMTATTHIDLRLRAAQHHIPTQIIHGGSIITAAPGLLGLQSYKFGRITTLAFPEKNYFPTSPYLVIKENKQRGLHTLVLLDIQAEHDIYMTANQGLELLEKMEALQHDRIITDDTLICIVGQAGSPQPTVVAHTLSTLKTMDFGPPLHCIIIPGSLHFMELDALEQFASLPSQLRHIIQKL